MTPKRGVVTGKCALNNRKLIRVSKATLPRMEELPFYTRLIPLNRKFAKTSDVSRRFLTFVKHLMFAWRKNKSWPMW